jgi:hypothetical protein
VTKSACGEAVQHWRIATVQRLGTTERASPTQSESRTAGSESVRLLVEQFGPPKHMIDVQFHMSSPTVRCVRGAGGLRFGL